MARVWLTSLIAVAIVVAATLVFTGDWSGNAEEPGKNRIAPAKRKLADGDVLVYLRVFPEIERVTLEAMRSSPPPSGAETRGRVRTILQNNKLTEREWHALRKRVWYVVHALRAEANRPRNKAELERRISEKEITMSRAGDSDETLKKQLRADLKVLYVLRDSPGISLHAADREQALGQWETLNLQVPRVK